MRSGSEASLTSRIFDAGGYLFGFRSPSGVIIERLEALFDDLPHGRALVEMNGPIETAGPVEMITVTSVDGTYELVDDSGATTYPDGLRAVDEVIRRINRRSLDADHSRLHLHAAAVERSGIGIVLCADSGTGKTSLTAALITRGFGYLSDEAVVLSSEYDSVSGFNKPLSLKDGPTGLVPDVARHHVGLDKGDHHHSHVPASSVGHVIDALDPSLVIMLRRDRVQSRTDASWRRLRPAEAVVALVESTLDLDRFGDRALAVLGALAVSASCVEVEAGSLDSTVDLVERLSRDLSRPATGRAVLLPSVPDLGAPWFVTDETQTLSIGDAVVVRQKKSGVVFELEDTAATLWLMLLTDPRSIEPTRSNEVFITELEALEVIGRRPMGAT